MDKNEYEQEIKELREEVKELKSSNLHSLNTINSLNTIGRKLTTQNEISLILKDILQNVKNITHANGATIYLLEDNKLKFRYILNDFLDINFDNQDSVVKDDIIWSNIEVCEANQDMVVVKSILDNKILNIPDLYSSKYYNFKGTKSFDEKTGYKSETTLSVPMKSLDGVVVGVVQLFNKIENGNVVGFNLVDQQIAESLASQASLSINNSRQLEVISHQSKLAAMGELIDMIAHQWKQPLNIINITASELELYLNNDIKIENKLLREMSTGTLEQVRHLSETLDEFRTFFRPDKIKKVVNIYDMLNDITELLKSDLTSNDIHVDITGDKTLELNIVESEFKHIFINMINNSKDAFIQNNIDKKRDIVINLKQTDYSSVIEFNDNAGGIEDSIMDKLFQANFTTKEESGGTGIGLYLAKQIVKKYDGDITAVNIDNGVCFSIILKK